MLTFNDACAEALSLGATVERVKDKAAGLAYVDASGTTEVLAELYDRGWLLVDGKARAWVDPAVPYRPPGEGGKAKPPEVRLVVEAVGVVCKAAEAMGVEPAEVLAMTAEQIRGRL